MKVYPCAIINDTQLISFEIDNIYVSKTTVANLLSSVKNVTNLKIRNAFSKSDEVLIWFEYEGEKFILWEPYGDSSRYWIGPEKTDGFTGDITPIASAFNVYKPPMLRRLLGGIVNLKF